MNFSFLEYLFPATPLNIKEQLFKVVFHKTVLEKFSNFTAKHLYRTFIFWKLQVSLQLDKRTPVSIHSSEAYKIFRNIFFIEHLQKQTPEVFYKKAVSLSHTWLIILFRPITLKNNWMSLCVKTERNCNESVNNEFKIMRKRFMTFWFNNESHSLWTDKRHLSCS